MKRAASPLIVLILSVGSVLLNAAAQTSNAPQKQDEKTEFSLPKRRAEAYETVARELRKLGYKIDFQDAAVRLRASRVFDPAAELRRSGFVNAKGPVFTDTAEIAFSGDDPTTISITVIRTGVSTSGGTAQLTVSRYANAEEEIRVALVGAEKRLEALASDYKLGPGTAPQTATVPDATVVQLKLKKAVTTTKEQPFAGELRVGPSGRLELVARFVPPRQGHVFWVFEVEFANSGATMIEIEGAGLDTKTVQGERVLFWKFLGTAYIPYSSSSWKLPSKKKESQKFLAEVAEGVQRLEFTCKGASPITVALK